MDWLIPVFEPCEPRLLMSGTPLSDLLASAVTVDVLPDQRTSAVGNIDEAASPVLYKFTAPAAGKIQMDLGALAGGIDPYLTLYSEALVRLAGNDDLARGNRDSRLSRLVAAGQTFYVLASGDAGTTGTFTLSITSDPRDDYGDQPDQARRLATALTGAAAIGGTINYNGDNDYLSFVATRTGLANVQIASPGRNSTLVPALTVRDAEDRPVNTQVVVSGALGEDLGADGDGSVSFAVVAGQKYYLQAAGTDGTVGGYTIRMRATLAQEFVAAEQVVVLPAGHQTASGSLLAGATFAYRFTAPANGYFLLEMGAANGSTVNSRLQVYNSDQRLVTSNDNASTRTTDSRVRLTVKQGQTYYVRASAAAGTAGAYALAFTSLPTDDYGNEAALARAITARTDGSVSGTGRINYAGDHDFLRYTATQSGRAEIVVGPYLRDANIKAALSIYAADGTLMDSALAGADGTLRIQWTVTAGTRYYFDLSGSDQTTGRYAWRVLPTVLVDFAIAQDVAVSTLGARAVTGTLAIGGFKTYKFTALADGTMTVDMAAANGSALDARLEAYDSAQRRLAANDNASANTISSRVSFVVRAGQTYYIRAMAAPQTQGDYTLTFTSQPTDDAGNDVPHATSLVLGVDGSGSAAKFVNYIADVDVLRIVATATGTMEIRMAENSGSGVKPSLTATSAAGESLATNGDGSSEAVITFDVIAGQTYYLTASALDATTGRYALTISTAPVAPEPDPTPDPDPDPPADPLPGASIIGTVVTDGSGTRLVIVGTDGNDVITLSYAGQATILRTAYGTQSFLGQYSQIVIYGFAGDDVIRDDYSITGSVAVYAGDGADTIYDNGPGVSFVYAGEGSDLIVSVGGGIDTIYAQGGMDSVWADQTDLLMDGAAAELTAGNLHRIGSFYQPYTSNPNLAGWVSKEVAGQNLQDPAANSYASGWANFANRPLFAGTPTYNDIRQGSVGDCYYLASLSSLADTDPDILHQMIVSLGDGTYAMRFYRNNQEVYVRLDADLPIYSGSSLSYAKLTPDGEIWVALAEKAYCYFRYGQNSYDSISGGWMTTVYQELTGKAASSVWTGNSAASLASTIAAALAAGHAVTAGTYSNPASPIVGGHAYEVKAIEGVGDAAIVTVYNPWGYDGRGNDGNTSDGLIRITIQLFQSCYSAVVISAA